MFCEGMHIAAIPNRSARRTYLLRKSVRDGRRVTTQTLTDLSALSIEQIEAMRRVLKGEKLGPLGGAFDCIGSKLYGHVDTVRTAMIAVRIITPTASKLGVAGAFADTTLADDVALRGVDEDELYQSMDWLLERQGKIEKRHLKEGGLVLFDLTSSYFEGVTCPLAKRGYSRDRKPDTLQVNYGLLTDERG